jgi:hypothetical protein
MMIPVDMVKEEENDGMRENFSLFATFIPYYAIGSVLNIIKENFKVRNNNVFILRDLTDKTRLILTFNAERYVGTPPMRFINIHRKKENNTLYTLNALNKLVEQKNDGKIDHNFKIDWEDENLKNTFVLIQDGELKFIKTSLKSVIDLTKEYKPRKKRSYNENTEN